MVVSYILLGLVFAFIIEYTKDRIRGKWPSLMPGDDPLDTWMRFFMVILWPLCLAVFLIGFCRTYFKK